MTRRKTPRPKALWVMARHWKKPKTIANAMSRIRPATASRAAEQRRYRAQVKVWLAEPANMWCKVGIVTTGITRRATQCHHFAGRRGRLLNWEPGWVPVSDAGHRWINANPKRAVELGLVGPVGTWNDFARAKAHLGL